LWTVRERLDEAVYDGVPVAVPWPLYEVSYNLNGRVEFFKRDFEGLKCPKS
jgi:hypothetical protein